MKGYKLARLPKDVAMRVDLTEVERLALIEAAREYIRESANSPAPRLAPLMSALAKLDPSSG